MTDPISWILVSILALLTASMIAALIRLIIGPSLIDRVAAFDVLTILVMGTIITYAVYRGQDALLDAAVILALVAFLATLAMARFILAEHKAHRRWP